MNIQLTSQALRTFDFGKVPSPKLSFPQYPLDQPFVALFRGNACVEAREQRPKNQIRTVPSRARDIVAEDLQKSHYMHVQDAWYVIGRLSPSLPWKKESTHEKHCLSSGDNRHVVGSLICDLQTFKGLFSTVSQPIVASQYTLERRICTEKYMWKGNMEKQLENILYQLSN